MQNRKWDWGKWNKRKWQWEKRWLTLTSEYISRKINHIFEESTSFTHKLNTLRNNHTKYSTAHHQRQPEKSIKLWILLLNSIALTESKMCIDAAVGFTNAWPCLHFAHTREKSADCSPEGERIINLAWIVSPTLTLKMQQLRIYSGLY